jgi:hypothetical protein
MRDLRVLVPLSVMTALLFIYAGFLLTLAQSDVLASATALELGVFVLQLGKTLAIVSIKRLRNARVSFLIDIYGAEFFAIPVIAIVYLGFGYQGLASVVNQIFQSWVVGVAVSGLPYATYRIGRDMHGREKLSGILPASVVVTELELIFAAAATSAAASHSGIAGLAKDVIVPSLQAAIGGAIPSGATTFVPLVVTYTSLLVYSVIYSDPRAGIRENLLLVLAVLVTFATAALILAVSGFVQVLSLLLVPPTFLIAALTWWFTRAS